MKTAGSIADQISEQTKELIDFYFEDTEDGFSKVKNFDETGIWELKNKILKLGNIPKETKLGLEMLAKQALIDINKKIPGLYNESLMRVSTKKLLDQPELKSYIASQNSGVDFVGFEPKFENIKVELDEGKEI